MPLAKVTDINSSVSYALWRIEEPLSALVQQYTLSPADRVILDEYKVETRKMEWLSARLALKALLKQQGLDGLSIYKDDCGKPHLVDSIAHISISHTKGYGAAVLNIAGPAGIDIEHPRPQVQRIARKFLHADEQSWTGDDLGKLTQAWCAKEALYKLHGRTQLLFAEQLFVHQPNGQLYPQGEIRENNSIAKYDLHFANHEGLITCVAHK